MAEHLGVRIVPIAFLGIAAYSLAYLGVAFTDDATRWWWWFVPIYGSVQIFDTSAGWGLFHVGILPAIWIAGAAIAAAEGYPALTSLTASTSRVSQADPALAAVAEDTFARTNWRIKTRTMPAYTQQNTEDWDFRYCSPGDPAYDVEADLFLSVHYTTVVAIDSLRLFIINSLLGGGFAKVTQDGEHVRFVIEQSDDFLNGTKRANSRFTREGRLERKSSKRSVAKTASTNSSASRYCPRRRFSASKPQARPGS